MNGIEMIDPGTTIRASFVIVNYNRKDELLITITKTKDISKTAAGTFEIVVVDNASNDGSAEAVKAYHPDVVLIENKVNTGAPGWNLGFEKANGAYFIILDDDSHMESGLEDALEFLDVNPDVGVVACNIKGGMFGTSDWEDLGDTIGFIGCGAFFRKKVYDEIGGYADWIFLYNNEWDLGMRVLQAGYKLKYFAKCHVTHRASPLNRTTKRLKVFSIRNEMAVVYKYYNKDQRNLYLFRVYMNNLKEIKRLGLSSIPWFYEALKEFFKLIKTLPYTPVSKELERMYTKKYWPARPFLGLI
ncbi:MAG: glycosyltransferase [Bacteroidota bacterium]|nr:glycosyltransferase [Bacteroidota bacterium]